MCQSHSKEGEKVVEGEGFSNVHRDLCRYHGIDMGSSPPFSFPPLIFALNLRYTLTGYQYMPIGAGSIGVTAA